MELVELVDKQDNFLGVMEKLLAHKEAKLHRAISVFVFNTSGSLLLQRRAATKYHSALLWTNTCCTHPQPNETTLHAANRRLLEEMGLICNLEKKFSFVYKAQLDNDLTEHEYDHVFFGVTDELPILNPYEVDAWKYETLDAISHDLVNNSHAYTVWFKLIFEQIKELRK